MAYVLGLDPHESTLGVTDGTTPGLPAILQGEDGKRFVFLRDPDASDVSYTVETSSDLQSWNPVTEGIVETVLDNGMRKVEVLIPDDQQVFCRLGVSR